ncbi:hypothetical protein Ppa06_52620 [Planomonospora parontospora subsp. parontospora]|uniref:Uncharacterized protein n=2 Tax=Planomonospora parontospora TaxID=58119 RepID=A0AA37BL09_9ACTN|nr:hypothetical protein GCM10010126_53050 [Planomonospora parontospora]GII11464.1 hypothetical protein Ppa06_52620 [Planomonospora parontospora subsp. parontospora]
MKNMEKRGMLCAETHRSETTAADAPRPNTADGRPGTAPARELRTRAADTRAVSGTTMERSTKRMAPKSRVPMPDPPGTGTAVPGPTGDRWAGTSPAMTRRLQRRVRTS